eukprot:UN09734
MLNAMVSLFDDKQSHMSQHDVSTSEEGEHHSHNSRNSHHHHHFDDDDDDDDRNGSEGSHIDEIDLAMTR